MLKLASKISLREFVFENIGQFKFDHMTHCYILHLGYNFVLALLTA